MHTRSYSYVALLTHYDGGVSVTFPDLPGAVSHGVDETDAAHNAQACLQLHLAGMAEDGDFMPRAHTAAELIAQHPLSAGQMYALVTCICQCGIASCDRLSAAS